MARNSVCLFVLAIAACAAAAGLTRRPQLPTRVAEKDFLKRQRDILRLTYHVQDRNVHLDQLEIAKTYDVEQNINNYATPDVVKNFMSLYKEGLLPKASVFTILHHKQRHEMMSLFHLFHCANDFETFYKTACWAREHVNEAMFVYALSVAVLHRTDCYGIVLPAPYEIFPNYFFNSEVINRATVVKMHGPKNLHDIERVSTVESNVVIINSNYSGWYLRFNEEQKMSYFTEDVGLNAYYYYYQLDYPFWMGGDMFKLHKDRRGELFFYMHQQLLARYYLERLSNGLGEIPVFSWHWPMETGYYPSLVYHNGLEFPVRPNHYDMRYPEHLVLLQEVEDYERRIRDVIDYGFVILPNGDKLNIRKPEAIDVLGKLIECNPDSPNTRAYRHVLVVASVLIGNTVRPLSDHTVIPSALEHPQTCMRDPAFYQMYKRFIGYFFQFKNHLPPYTYEEISCPGVKIDSIDVDKMLTYFDHFDVDITNVVHQNEEEVTRMDDDIKIRVRQPRLNHKPWQVRIHVTADRAQLVLVKMFLGPKYDSNGRAMPIDENRVNFVELDQFKIELNDGANTITRNSQDSIYNIGDFTPAHEIWTRVNKAMEGTEEFHIDNSEAHNGWPDRLMLPKGTKGGMPFVLYVCITPYHEPKVPFGKGFDHVISTGVGSGAKYLSDDAFGFPLDRHIHETDFYLPNMLFKDVLIYHKGETEINLPHQD